MFKSRILQPDFRRQEENIEVSRSSSGRLPPLRKKPLFEALESRLLLSADLSVPGLEAALHQGLTDFTDRLDNFLDTNEILNTPLPLVVRAEGEAPNQTTVAATLKDLLTVPVDYSGDGIIDTTPGSIEQLLDVLDTDASGTPGFGKVDIRELLLGGLADKVSDATDGVAAYAAAHPVSTLADYFNQTSFDQTIGDLELIVDATNTSNAHEVSANLSVTLAFGNTLPLDLGIGADDLGISFPNSTLDLNASLNLSAEVGVVTSGEDATVGDFFIETGNLTASANASINPFNAAVNVGFLGAQVTNGVISLTAQAQSSLTDPRDATGLGFAATSGTQSITAGSAPASNTLADPAAFLLRIGDTDTREVVVAPSANGSIADLINDVQASVDTAGFTGLVTVGESAGRITLSLPSALDVAALDFGNDVSVAAGGVLKTASAVAANDAAVAALTGTSRFLFAADHGLPVLVSLDLDSTALDTVAELLGAINLVINSRGAEAVVGTGADAGRLVIQSTGTAKPLQITRAIALDSKITAGDIQAATLSDLITAPSTAGSGVTVDLPVSVTGLPGFSVSGAEITFSGNPFSAGTLQTDDNGNQRLSFSLGTPNFGELLNFNNLGVSGVISILGKVADWLDGLRQSSFISGVDIPFAEQALGNVLDLADALRDALLFDDNDTPDDLLDDHPRLLNGANEPMFTTAQELATRLDAILPGPFSVTYDALHDELRFGLVISDTLATQALEVDLGTSIGDFAGISASGSISFDASVGLSLTLGFYLGGALSDSLIDGTTPLSSLNDGDGAGIKDELAITGVSDVRTIFGRLSGDAKFTVQFDAGPVVTVTVPKTNTDNNLTVANLVADLNAAFQNNATVPDGADADTNPDLNPIHTRISAVADGNRIRFNVTDGTVSSVTIAAQSTDPAASEVGISAGTVNRTDGVLAFRTARDVPVVVGQLTGNATFNVSINGSAAQPVTVAQADTVDNPATTGSDEGNRNILDVVQDVNRALFHKVTGSDLADFSPGADVGFRITLASANTLLNGQFIDITVPDAQTSGATDIDDLVLVVNDRIQSALITALSGAAGSSGTDDLTTPLVLEARAVGNAIQLVATSGVVKGFSVSDVTPGSLAKLGLSAVSSAGLSDKIVASSQGTRLVFTAVDPAVTSFTVTPGTGAAQLGLGSALTANEHDLVIYTRDASLNGGSFRVSLDGDTTIQDVIDSVAAAAPKIIVGGTPNQPAVILQVSADGTRLEAIDRSSGGGTFRIEPINGSAAAAKLGILKSDVSNDEDTPDGKIEGLPLGGLTLADRLFLENAIVSADVAVAVPSVNIDASLGFVGVHLTGTGGFGADFSAGLKSPGATTAGGRVTLAQLVDGLGDIGSVVATPTLALDSANPFGNKLTLTLSTTPSFTALGVDNPNVEIALLSLGDPFGDPATAPQIEARSSGLPDLSGLGDLFDARDLNLSNILAGLDALVDFLNQFEAFGFLSEPLPVVGVSVNDLMGVAEKFSAAIQEFESDPSGSIQALEERLFQALGLPSGTNLIDFSLEVDGDVELLRLNLGYNVGFVEELGIDLDLSDFVGPELGEVVRLAGSAGLQASGNLDLSLDFGFDLANPTDVYLFDTTGIAASIAAAGTELTFRAALGPVGLFITGGTANISASVTAGINPSAIPAGSNRVLVSDLFSGDILGNIDINPSGSITAILPAYFPTESVSAGNITLAVDLLNPGELTVSVPNFSIDPSQFSLLNNMMLALDGIDLFLSGLQDVLDGEVFGLELPLIGDSLADAAQFIADFREDFIGTFREKLGTVASPTENIISQLLFDLLSADTDGSGPDIGLNLLRDFNPGDGETNVTIEDIILDTNIDDPATLPEQVFMQWNMLLGGELLDVGTGIGFDLGIPGLGLSTEGDINLNIDWELDFGFGLSFQDGFYLDISSPSELTVSVAADITGLEVTGKLGFLQIVAVERTGAGHEETTHLAATFGIDVYNRRNASDTKLGFSELGGIGIAPTVHADALADLSLALELNSDLVPGASTNFPRVVAGFELRWELGTEQAPINLLTANIGNAISEGLKLVEFQDVSLDLGSFISDVVGPIVQEVQKITKPIQPIIEFLTTPIPVISDLGPPVTLLDIAGAFGKVDPSMIKALADIITLVNSIPTSADNLLINFGDFTIFDADDTAGSALAVSDLVAGKPRDPDTITKPTANNFDSELANKPASQTKSFAQKLKSGGFGSGFSFPLLESPSDIFGLLLGDDVTLIGYDLPQLSFDFEWSQFFSIFGPLGVSITAQAGATIDFAFGYDTAGIRAFADSGFRNPELLFEGFFVSDNPTDVTGAGPDLPELTLTAGFSAAAELNLGVARAGVAGGIFGEIDFNLFDPNHDGKVRITEIVNSVVDQARFGGDLAFLAPLAIFDISGEIFAKLFAFLKIDLFFFSFSEEWNITPPITLLEFDIPFTRTPSLSDELAGGVLQLNLGEFAAQRINGSLVDGDETFTVTGDASSLTVTAFGVTKTYTPDESGTWSRIIALGGEGNDTLNLWGVGGNIEFEIDGGAGDDHIYLTNPGNPAQTVSGKAVIRGGLGDDEIWGGAGDDTIWGEAGTDTIHGAGGSDLIFGDDGTISDNDTATRADDSFFVAMGPKDARDILYGDGGDDFLFGGGGDDEIHGGANLDLIIGDAAKMVRIGTALEVQDHDAEQGGVDTIFGDGENDRIYSGGGGDTIDAGAGDDLVYAGTGRDTVTTAGSGVDTVYGGAGNDTINGGEGGDFLFGEAGNDVVNGQGGDDEIRGGIGADRLTGGTGNDKLWGEADPDILEGNDGDDRLDGGYGNDNLTGGAGTDTLYAGFGSDTLDGGAARDVYFISTRGGRTSELTTLYDSGADADGVDELTINGTVENDVFLLRAMADAYVPGGNDTAFVAKINAGGAGLERYNYRNIEFITLNGFVGDDRFVSDDTKAGVTINGGPGRDDFQIGQMFKSRRDTNAETADLAADDVFDVGGTVETTRGWLSNGVSSPMTINGGDDNDTFTVFRNKAVLTLAGGDGDDLFTVRAFALAGSVDDDRARTDMKGDGGADTILYAINAPVGIDGGDGFDTVRVIGTEFKDDFVVTDTGVFGAGLNVTYVNVERLTVDGAEGDDRYFVLSTDASVVTEIAGGLGSDTFLMGGSPNGEPIAVVSNDLKGHSGLILHSVESVANGWDGIPVDGLSANVADNDEDFIVITPSDGVSRVMEGAPLLDGAGWGFDTYTVALTRTPDEEVTVSIQAPVLPPEDQAKGARSLEFWNGSTWASTLQLHFTTASSQSVMFRAANDTADEGTSFGLINHVVSSDDAGYNELPALSVKVQILDNDEAGVIVRPTGTETRVVEGFPGSEEGLALDRYDVILSRPSTQPVTVTLTALNDQVKLSATSLVFAPGEVSKTVTVTARDDGVLEGFHSDFIRATVASADADVTVSQARYQIDFNPDLAGNQEIPVDDPQTFVLLKHKPQADTVQLWVDNVLQAASTYRVIGNTLVFVDEFGQPNPTSGKVEVAYSHVVEGFHETPVNQVVVDVYDKQAPTVLVMQSDASTDVIEGGVTDGYRVVLTSDPGEGETVTINVAPQKTRSTVGGTAHFEQQVDVSATSLTFTGGELGDWMTPQTVTVTAIDDGIIDGSDTQVFDSSVRTVNKIRGPLYVEGASGEGSISLPEPLMLPGELNIRASTGEVRAFTGSTGEGAIEALTVDTADLEAALASLGLATLNDLVGRTVEITGGPGLDRIFQILNVSAGSVPDTSVLLLQNPSQVDAGQAEDPTPASKYAITSLSANFFVNETEQVDYLMVFDAESVANETGSLTSQEIDGQVKGRVTGFGMGPDIEIGGGLRGGGITYGDMEVVRVDLGRGNDQVTVDYATRRPDNPLTPEDESAFYTLTLLNTGLGDDTVTVNLREGEDGAFALRGGAGNDHVDGQLSTRQLVVFGEQGDDQIWGGTADDILFGDIGRVDYVNDSGEIITRLGHTWPQNPVNPPVSSADATSVTDTTATFPTEYGGLAGLAVQAISPAGLVQNRVISANTGDTLTVSQPWTIIPDSSYFYRVSMLPEDQTDGVVRGPRVLWSIENETGGTDTIHGLAGADIIVGGAAGDTLYGELGDDIMAGDNARLDFDPVSGRDGLTAVVLLQTTGPDLGGVDVIDSAEGDDIVLGGAAGDVITTVAGSDIVLGDNGLLGWKDGDADASTLDRVESYNDGLGGGDDIHAGDGDNIVLAGMGADAVMAGAGADIVLGDNGRVLSVGGVLATIETSDVSGATGGADTVFAGAGSDVVLAGALGDEVHGEAGTDILLGDNGVLQYLADADALLDTIETGDPAFGGADTLLGGDGDDVVIGGAAGDFLYGDWDSGVPGTGNDLLAGDGITIEYAGAAFLTVRSRDTAVGGVDTVEGNGGRDLILGGAAGDVNFGDGIAAHMAGDDASDVMLGDNGLLEFADGALQVITVIDPTIGGEDVMEGNADRDILIGGTAGDTLHGDTGTVDAGAGDANDLMFGDHGEVDFRLPPNANFTAIFTGEDDGGGDDLMYGNGADDIMLGQQGFDRMFGGDGDDDMWGGHNVAGGNDTGDAMDGGAGFDVMAGDNAIILRRADVLSPLIRSLVGTTLFHGYSGTVNDGAAAVTPDWQPNPNMEAGDFTRDITLLDHAADSVAALYGDDRMAGGAGDDLMFGQLGDDVMLGDGSVTVAGDLVLHVEAAGDGDDYMEGNGGADTMYGNLGQDDMLGGSSDLFGLTTPAQRPGGDDTLYGGAGTDAGRYYEDAVNLHARDADVILGDNGRIFRVVGTNGAGGGGFLTFNYDAVNAEAVRIIPRAYDLLDYTPGTGATTDVGGIDLVFGESGDDIIHGMVGDDILFGNAGDDDLYGGAGGDWISGGNGVDGMLGDDGRIFTSRNGLTEPLNGVTAANLQETITTPGSWLTATLYTTGELNKRVDLEPFDQGGDDTLYGGLGDDFMHGGAGIDGMSGAEAEAPFYEAAAARFAAGTAKPALVFDEATGRFTDFDNTQPLAKIAGFHLNFEATDGTGAKINDGNDRMFGDLGHDWLVGGTNSDHLYGGYGNDVMNGDDNLDTAGTDPITGQFGDADIAFGGAGRDQLIANTGADRLIDWSGEFNAYWVPFSPFGQGTVSRAVAPHIPDFLYALSRADGADFTRPGDPARNGEPNGELGLVRQGDPDWNLQHGGPADPQAGNGKDKKDVQR